MSLTESTEGQSQQVVIKVMGNEPPNWTQETGRPVQTTAQGADTLSSHESVHYVD